MPRLIVAGISSQLAKKHKNYDPGLPRMWQFLVFKSDYDKPVLQTCWPRVIECANESSHGGAHILAFHHRREERRRFEDEVFAKHRLLWVDIRQMHSYGKPDFAGILLKLVEFEEQWRKSLRPTKDSPLMLPQAVFKARGEEAQIWARAQAVRRDNDTINDVGSLIRKFRQRYYTRRGLWRRWIDEEGKVFTNDKSLHASVPADRRWKFTFEPEVGFHFDVAGPGGREFSLLDASGALSRPARYFNVDFHGYLRPKDRS